MLAKPAPISDLVAGLSGPESRAARPAARTSAVAKRPTFEVARFRRASERRNAWVTNTWMADWVTS